MWYQWLIFGCIAFLAPFLIFYARSKVCRKARKITKEQKQHYIFVALRYTMFYMLCDLFFMSFIIDNIVCKFVFGCLISITTLCNLSQVIIGIKDKVNTLTKIGIIQDFIIGIGISVFLIYIIPDKELQTIILAIISALFGGLLTLTGVAWTIRKSEIDKKEDEKKKHIPYIIKITEPLQNEPKVSFSYQWHGLNLNMEEDRKKINGNAIFATVFREFSIKNISEYPIILDSIYIDDYEMPFSEKTLVEKGMTYSIDTIQGIYFSIKLVQKMEIIVQDILENKYKISCHFSHDEKKHNNSDTQHYGNQEYTTNTKHYKIDSISLPIEIKE